MKQEAIQNIKNYWKFRTFFPEIEDYTEQIIIKPEGMLKMLDSSIGPILLSKGITKEGISNFVKTLYETVDEDEIYPMINLIASPPFDLYHNLNKIVCIKEKCYEKGLNDKTINWLTTHKFPGGANVGSFEAFLITMFNKMDNPPSGDVRFNGIDLVEVKGSGGRLRGQYGYTNGIINYIQELVYQFPPNTIELPPSYLHYNIGKDTINVIFRKIQDKRLEKSIEEARYKEKLEGKLKRMRGASGNQATKKYKATKDSYEKYKNNIPRSIVTLEEDILKLQENQKNCFLENVSKKLAETSLDYSVNFLVKIFARKYTNAEDAKIEKFIRGGLKIDGTFNSNFLNEYFIFEFEYYQFLEKFKYFCLVNLKEDLMLIIDSPVQFRKFVYSGNIIIKTTPSFSEHAGQQGMVFSIELKNDIKQKVG